MAASVEGVLSNDLQSFVTTSHVLVVGAGGIGCELLKNLLLTGFQNIEIIDLDTIDVSNLNRQFLFQKAHVGKSKAEVAKEESKKFNPNAKVKAYHDSIMNSDYDVNFFRKFSIVMNALDNRAARSHVNRMCLAADVPLIESGTAGYLGQVTIIKKGLTECYECDPKPAQKTYPGCTIRNTPSEPIHCIVWAKHLFNQLFGEDDPDEDVSPDMADPELGGKADAEALLQKMNAKGNIERMSTRAWSAACGYDPEKLFNKLFHDDIEYLLCMENLWKTRRRPTPLHWGNLPDAVAGSSSQGPAGLRDQNVWSVKECAEVFESSMKVLRKRLEALPADEDNLIWDKDDEPSMNFVTACANIRAFCFGIPQKSKFDVKSMAGNIIPAIATTNAIIAGLIVLQAMKILQGNIAECKPVYLRRNPNYMKKLLSSCLISKPNPKCYVCSSKPEVSVRLDTSSITVKVFEEKVLKGGLSMVAPDVEIEGKGTILISSEEGETDDNMDKVLQDFGIRNGARLKCDDFLQNFQVIVNIVHSDKIENGLEFEIIGDVDKLKMQATEEEANNKNENAQENRPDSSEISLDADDEDDLLIVEDDEDKYPMSRKRKASGDAEESLLAAKKSRQDADDGIITVDIS